ncbi:hypothetical protein VSAK1_09578 [Vibrio mediterranei AK1]|uniref:methyltransferase domain-containing protein n=1 Tax=Vibrio mediterranei TaxID=689 RepID=UPI0001540F03|nr:methyltransferase domain-containing protein [Vibrio mediterranei]EDL53902.1 hypothetical protein VSAK1_09578 [Vibrio mediterranei AK1]
MKLNVGPGPKWNCNGWSTIDYYHDADFRIDLRSDYVLPISDEVVSKVFCSHVIEHLSDDSVLQLFKEVYRTLSFGGIFRLSCPDVTKAIDAFVTRQDEFFYNDEVLLKGDSIETRLLNFICSFKCNDYHGQHDYIGGPVGMDSYVEEQLKLPVDDFVRWVSALMPEEAYYKAHINGWYFDKIERFLNQSGFEVVIKSDFKASIDNELRKGMFDNRPIQSVYVEAIKLPSSFCCRICGDTNQPSFIRMNDEFAMPILKCAHCGFVQTSPVHQSYLDRYYQTDFRTERARYTEAQFDFFSARAKHQIEFIENKLASAQCQAVLDLGAGVGTLPDALSNKFTQVYAYEPDPKVLDYYIDKPHIKLITCQSGLDAIEQKFDLITCSHVFEHVIQPISFLNNVSSKLLDNGLLFIEIPLENEDYLCSHKFGNKSGHFNHFDKSFALQFFEGLTNLELIDVTLSGPTLNGFLSGDEALKDNLENKGTNSEGIHLRVLLRRTESNETMSQPALDLSAFSFQSFSLAKSQSYLSDEKKKQTKANRELAKKANTLSLENQNLARVKKELQKECTQLKDKLHVSQRKLKVSDRKLQDILSSHSWKVTKPIRYIVEYFRRIK